MDGSIAVINAGSSSIKFAIYEADGLRFRGRVEQIAVSPKLRVADAGGAVVVDENWSGEVIDHGAATRRLLETAIRMAEAGVGVAFLPELALRERLQAGTLAIVADPPVAFADQLYVVRRKGIRPTPAARAVLEALGAL